MPSLIIPQHPFRPSPPTYDFDPRGSTSSFGSNDSHGSYASSSSTPKPHGIRRFSTTRSSGEMQRPVVDKATPKHGTLDFTIESPPLVMYGSPKDSTGALLSGLLNLHLSSAIDFDTLTLTLNARVQTRRPVCVGCPECIQRVSKLKEWRFLSKSSNHSLKAGRHVYPFSFLLPGHLPSSTDSTIGSISYTLDARALTPAGDTINASHTLNVMRSTVPAANTPWRQSVRIFPPTTLSANVSLPPVTHIGSSFPLELRLDGIVGPTTRWRLRKLTWRIDENAKIVSSPCTAHEAKVGGAGKGVLHEDSRSVASGELKRGWKMDFDFVNDTHHGRVELEIPSVGLPVNSGPARHDLHGHVSNDVESSAGLSISHSLVIEMIVAEENLPTKASKLVTPTGAARVLRMQFPLNVTEKAGMGISWDEEQPPVYGDVPDSPPSYGTVVMEELGEEEFAALGL